MSEQANKDKYPNEVWVDLKLEGFIQNNQYKISNYGRIKSHAFDKENGRMLKGSIVGGYPAIVLRTPDNRSTTRYVHKLVAEHFVPKEDPLKNHVIHLDYAKMNNYFENLRWATLEETHIHAANNPTPRKVRRTGYKLNEAKVRQIKILLKKNKTRLKMIAKQFGITHTQLNRIRAGENWGHVTITDADLLED